MLYRYETYKNETYTGKGFLTGLRLVDFLSDKQVRNLARPFSKALPFSIIPDAIASTSLFTERGKEELVFYIQRCIEAYKTHEKQSGISVRLLEINENLVSDFILYEDSMQVLVKAERIDEIRAHLSIGNVQ